MSTPTLSTPEAAPKRDTHWLPGIEAMRAVAALAVVVHHSYTLGDLKPVPFSTYIWGLGEWGVDLFFLLSAFLLCDYFWRDAQRRSLVVFYTRRILRIAPAYYACLFILFFFFADRAQLFSAQGVEQLLANGTFTHYLRPGTSSSLNVDGALWTLTIEFLLYLVMPILAFSMGRRSWPIAVGLLGAGIAYRLWIAHGVTPLEAALFPSPDGVSEGIRRLYLARQLVGFLPLFLLGIALRRLLVEGALPARLVAPARSISTPAFVALLLPSLLLLREVNKASDYHHWFLFTFYDIGLGLLALPLLLYCARPIRGALGPVMRGLVWLGRRSYGLYLWHFPVILVIYQRGPQLLPPHLGHRPLRLIVILAIAIGLAAASYRFVELPAMDLAKRLTGQWIDRRARQTQGPRRGEHDTLPSGTRG